MNGPLRRLRGLPLRHRFLVVPLLALAVWTVLAAAFVWESQRQSELLGRIVEQDMARFNRYSGVFGALTERHTDVYDLLHNAGRANEEALYLESRRHIHEIQRAVDDLAAALGSARARTTSVESRTEHDALLGHAQGYRDGVAAAIGMTTTNLALAPAQLALANARFSAMSQSFARFLEYERAVIAAEVAARNRDSNVNTATIAASGAVAIVLLLGLMLVLSHLLARALEAQIAALTELGMQAGASISPTGSNEIERITEAVGAFRQSLLELRRARDELEDRVRERTRELQHANSELRSEVVLRTEAERALRIYVEVIRSTGEAVVITDPQGRIVEVNPAHQRATGQSRDETIGTVLRALSTPFSPDDEAEDIWESLDAKGYWTGEMLDRRTGGELFPSWVLINAVRDEAGTVQHYVSVSRDITALKENERQLERLAFYDTLTGLPNRALFHDRLGVALANAERQHTPLALMSVDLDRFKFVNDTLGHATGDRLLAEVGRRIGECLRSADTLARMGGDEFLILLPFLGSMGHAMQIAERIVQSVGQPTPLGDEVVYVGASVGVCIYPGDGRDAETLQRNVDLAMYEAKHGGRGQYRMFAPEMIDRNTQRLSLSVEIDAALRRDEFTLYYQPVINLASGEPEGLKALIRWRDRNGEWIDPDTFIPHAEEVGLIMKVDGWVLERACQDAAGWLRDGTGALPVRVNLSAISLRQSDMVRAIDAALERSGLPPAMLNLEITEIALSHDPQAAYATLERIASLGVRFSVNDFGTSYSSLSYLSQFPISFLKLDRAFIDRIGKDDASEEVIRTLLELAGKLKVRVVAEGVENPEQQAFLALAGCELMQGFHLVEPMSGEQLVMWLATRDRPRIAG